SAHIPRGSIGSSRQGLGVQQHGPSKVLRYCSWRVPKRDGVEQRRSQPQVGRPSGCDAATLCRRIGTQVFERSKFGAKVLVINDDVDATNTAEVVWAFATRCHPVAGEIHFDQEATSPLVAFLESSEKISGRTPKVVYNCLSPE